MKHNSAMENHSYVGILNRELMTAYMELVRFDVGLYPVLNEATVLNDSIEKADILCAI